MSKYVMKIYKNTAALLVTVIFMAVIGLVLKSVVPTWACMVMAATAAVWIAIFAYRTIIWCARLKNSERHINIK